MLRRWTAILGFTGSLFTPALAAAQPAATTISAITSAPERYADRPVTLTGRFRGRSALAEANAVPLKRSRWDFLLKEDGATVWVSGLRPAGWDFDLDPASADDSRAGRWLEVTGTVRVRGRHGERCSSPAACRHVWIEASDLRQASPPRESDGGGASRPAVSPPALVFHDPIDDETDVPRTGAVRLQFSRQMVAATFSERVVVSYASVRGLSAPPIPKFSAIYQEASRSLLITFAEPLDSCRTVLVELRDGIAAVNGRLLAPAGFTFTTGR